MKIKLLKKVRKRFSIYKIDRIGGNSIPYLKSFVEDYGLPIYRLKYKKAFINYYKNYDKAIEEIIKMVRSFYPELGSKKEMSTKVWWNK